MEERPSDLTIVLRVSHGPPSACEPDTKRLPYEILDIKEVSGKKRLRTKAKTFELEDTVKEKLQENLEDLDKLLEDIGQREIREIREILGERERERENQTRSVGVGGLSDSVDSQMLFNLFCNYGNISCILCQGGKAFVFYQSEDFAL